MHACSCGVAEPNEMNCMFCLQTQQTNDFINELHYKLNYTGATYGSDFGKKEILLLLNCLLKLSSRQTEVAMNNKCSFC